MSHTFASRPTATRIRGRGGRQNFPTQTKLQPLEPRGKKTQTKSTVLTNRGRGRTAGRQTGSGKTSMDPSQNRQYIGNEEETGPAQGNSLEQRAVYAGGYTMISPSEKKRQNIAAQAEREALQYEEYKQRNKVTRVSYVGTVGGGQTECNARQQQAMMQQSLNKTSRLLKEQERKSKLREAEELQLAQKKEAARRQSELNEQRKKDKQDKWKDEMRRVNQSFLNKLEAQTKGSSSQSSGSSAPSGQKNPQATAKPAPARPTSVRTSAERGVHFGALLSTGSAGEVESRDGRQPSSWTHNMARRSYNGQGISGEDSQSRLLREGGEVSRQWEFPAQARNQRMYADFDTADSSDQVYGDSRFQTGAEFDYNVDVLQSILPHVDRLQLSEALQEANGSLNDALELLGI